MAVQLILFGRPGYPFMLISGINAARFENFQSIRQSKMSRVCQVTGKRTVTGNNVSHAHNKTRRKFYPNLHHRKFWIESEKRWVRLRVSNAGLRMIDKKGIEVVLNDLRARGEKV